jgi:hypothetical protein
MLIWTNTEPTVEKLLFIIIKFTQQVTYYHIYYFNMPWYQSLSSLYEYNVTFFTNYKWFLSNINWL